MPKVHWLLDANIFSEYLEELTAAISRHGDAYVIINRPNAPWTWDDAPNRYRGAFPAGACVITHADIDLARRVRENAVWKPGAFASSENYFWSQYAPYFQRWLLNQDYELLPFAELSPRRDEMLARFGANGQIFVRPDSPLKIFTGQLASIATFDRDLEYMAFYEFPTESIVVVSSPKKILGEWRTVVAEGRVVAATVYVERGEKTAKPCNDPRIIEFANVVSQCEFEPDPVWIMDLCETEDNKLHLLEIGMFSCASLYGCDKDLVVSAVSKAAGRFGGSCSSSNRETGGESQ